MLIHRGIRPIHPLIQPNFKKKIYFEQLPDGTEKKWTLRQLNSGCGRGFTGSVIREMEGCIYCPYCDEYFSVEQWEKV